MFVFIFCLATQSSISEKSHSST